MRKTDNNSFKNIFIQEGDLFDLKKNNNQIIFAKEGILINENKKIFRLFNGKIISTNNNKLISFEFDKIDYNLSKFSVLKQLKKQKYKNCLHQK